MKDIYAVRYELFVSLIFFFCLSVVYICMKQNISKIHTHTNQNTILKFEIFEWLLLLINN